MLDDLLVLMSYTLKLFSVFQCSVINYISPIPNLNPNFMLNLEIAHTGSPRQIMKPLTIFVSRMYRSCCRLILAKNKMSGLSSPY